MFEMLSEVGEIFTMINKQRENGTSKTKLERKVDR